MGHVEGSNCNASGKYAHSQNYGTIAQGQAQTVIGSYNIAQGSASSQGTSDYAFIIGNGNYNTRNNALTVTWGGSLNTAGEITGSNLSGTNTGDETLNTLGELIDSAADKSNVNRTMIN